MLKQMSKYFELFFSKFECVFRKSFLAHQCLLSMLEKWKSAVDNQKRFGALLTDISKAFDCFLHDLLIAQLYTHRFSIGFFFFPITFYKIGARLLTNGKQKTRINSGCNSWE